MSYCEFVLRQEGFKRKQDWEKKLFREVAYQIFTIGKGLSGKSAGDKEKFWPIKEKVPVIISEEVQAEYIRQVEAYKKAVNG